MSCRELEVLIIGGTGEMGQWFAPFFNRNGFNVTVWGKSQRVDIAEKMGVRFAMDLDSAVARSDIVIISVPINITEKMIAETAPKMKSGSLLMDFTSLKVKPLEAMLSHAPPGVEVIGTHPMFGPSVSSLHGQIIILTPPTKRCRKWHPFIRSVFEENGAHIEIVDAGEHDLMVSVIQGLTHFAYIAIGTTFMQIDFDVARSRRFMSPVYEIMVDFVGRILDQNPYLYAMIQMENPEVLRVHEAFIEQCRHISDIVRRHDMEDFTQNMKAAATHFGDTSSAMRRSDKLINSKISEFDKIIDSLGKEKGFLHLYSNITHVGIVKKVTPREIILLRGKKEIKLKIENIRLLTDNELLEWKKENLQHFRRDISVLIPPGADPDIINTVISGIEGIIATNIIDTYTGLEDTDLLSVAYRITIQGDLDPGKVQNNIRELLEGLGCKLRS
ncbi:Prephenate dehydrogenase [Methanosalsum zhilinae DSM 4017]|uniref:Prephenate dehydrogenase n=1 Tax=Methanosalsum zhilinae (strain DSM 4017 / NBRC 107636 / OCM 62 / WeN5) TaxID=679901 RepID=F7XNN7_METZD|nr:prephenate dehydrogenase [Methanosalsum zhilinae]AEH60141.1 Prephenate dehydrogenase [Methanosalsum zhilinae DSM 4017]